MPAKTGRTIKVAGDSSVRFREARFMPDGKSIIALSTASGETEFWQFPANGIGAATQLTNDAHVLRWEGIPSPDGHWLAHRDKDQQLWIYDSKAKTDKRMAQSMAGDFNDLTWSPDSRWLAYVETAPDQFDQIKILNLDSGTIQSITSDRYNSENPVWSSDGKWLYFLSDRMLKTDHPLALGTARAGAPLRPCREDLRVSPHARPALALPSRRRVASRLCGEAAKTRNPTTNRKTRSQPQTTKKARQPTSPQLRKKKDEKNPPEVKIDFADLPSRLNEVPAPPGNYDELQATEKRLCWLNASDDTQEHRALQCVDIANKGDEVDTVLPDVKGYEISLDRKKIMVHKGDDFYIFDSDVKAASLADPKVLPKRTVNLSHWTMSTRPREEFRGIFLDAWRLERDYFYDRNMQGVDWNAMQRALSAPRRSRRRSRRTQRVIAQMVSELSALHTFVHGGDARKPADDVTLGTLGARLRRDEKAGGYVVEHIYQHDPDLPDLAPPLARPESLVQEGEVIVSIDGQDLLGISDERDAAARQGRAARCCSTSSPPTGRAARRAGHADQPRRRCRTALSRMGILPSPF